MQSEEVVENSGYSDAYRLTFAQKFGIVLIIIVGVALIICAGLMALMIFVASMVALAIRDGVSFVCQKIWCKFHKKN